MLIKKLPIANCQFANGDSKLLISRVLWLSNTIGNRQLEIGNDN